MQKIYAFIPARSGSERVKNKNMRILNGKPLISYTLGQIRNSKHINKTYISTDYKGIEKKLDLDKNTYVIKRPENISKSNSVDIDWVLHILKKIKDDLPDFIVLLRPTSPFRTSNFIDSSIEKFLKNPKYDSARAVKMVKEHPDKMWIKKNSGIIPYNGFKKNEKEDLHSMQFKSLDKVFIQTSSLEILNTKSILRNKKLSGRKILPLFSDNLNSFTIDYEFDFDIAELIAKNKIKIDI
ncbi:MAG: hypothetical protein CBE17_01740 [Gammaproteobacteria bacterium TMED257]|nr:MAG: hypothetical protein CBE17_01740 [Gammaproteobacteria bacterium TMED257]|tara:strand:+ start:8809 stop:9525 length:717 start_codon:yes stop_codon:yes gene_type:complete